MNASASEQWLKEGDSVRNVEDSITAVNLVQEIREGQPLLYLLQLLLTWIKLQEVLSVQS